MQPMKLLNGLTDLLGLSQNEATPSTSTAASSPPPAVTAATHYPGMGTISSKRSIAEINEQHLADDGSTIQRCSHSRRVHFPPAEGIVSGYHCPEPGPFSVRRPTQPPPPPPQIDINIDDEQPSVSAKPDVLDLEDIANAYRKACSITGAAAMPTVFQQIKCFHNNVHIRQQELSLKGIRVEHLQMEALEAILKRVQFDSLDFEYCFLDDDAMCSLAEMLEYYDSALKLNLSFNKNVTSRGWYALFKAMKKALGMWIRSVREAPRHITPSYHMESVGLNGSQLAQFAQAIRHADSLRELYLGDNNIQPVDRKNLFTLVAFCKSLSTLDFRNNKIGDEGVLELCRGLLHAGANCPLSMLVLWNCGLTGAAMEHLASSLNMCRALTTLNVGSNNLGEAGIAHLKPALMNADCALERLGLQSTKLTNTSAICLAEALADNNTLIRVDLRDNPAISSAGLLALHSAMRHNSSITLLNIDESLAIASSDKVRSCQDDFRRIFDEITEKCASNKVAALLRLPARALDNASDDDDDDDDEPAAAVNAREVTQEASPCSDTASLDDLAPQDIERSASVNFSPKERPRIAKLARSASLTCADHYPECTEMSDSNTSLEKKENAEAETASSSTSSNDLHDDTHQESIKTIRRGSSSSLLQQKSSWSSLPSIPAAASPPANVPAASAPAVKKFRRFSVSPTTSTLDLGPTLKRPASVSSSPVNIAAATPSATSASMPSSPLQSTFLNNNSKFGPIQEHEPFPPKPVAHTKFPTSVPPISDEPPRHDSSPPSQSADPATDVSNVVADLVNYVTTSSFVPPFIELPAETPTTPSRMLSIVPEHVETDEEIVLSVTRRLVREVLRQEKDALSDSLERKRTRLLNSASSSQPGTPVSSPSSSSSLS